MCQNHRDYKIAQGKKMARKLLYILILAGGISVYGQSHHIFAGVGLGLGFESVKESDSNKTLYSVFNYNIRGGYEYQFPEFFKTNIGVRTYIDYTMGIRPVGDDTIVTSLLGLNLDSSAHYYFNENLSLGGYFGLGLGYVNYVNAIVATSDDLPLIQSGLGYINIGISGVFNKNHRIEVGTKIPFTDIVANNAHTKIYYLLLQYDYIF